MTSQARVFWASRLPGLVLDSSTSGQEGERLQQAFHLHVRAVDPELVELVRAEHRGVEPDGVALGLAELLAGSIGDNRAGEHVDVHTAHLVD